MYNDYKTQIEILNYFCNNHNNYGKEDFIKNYIYHERGYKNIGTLLLQNMYYMEVMMVAKIYIHFQGGVNNCIKQGNNL